MTAYRPGRVVHPDGLPEHERVAAMSAVALGITLAVMDGAIANVALPSLARAMHATESATVRVVNGYQLAIVALLLPLAALGERIGYRRVYIPGLALFVLASASCAAARSLDELVASRVVQGFGAAAIMSVNAALVRMIFPAARLGRATGIVALVVSASAAAGPTVASAILSVAHWPFLFLVNVPIGAAALATGARALPASPHGERPFPWRPASVSACAFAGVRRARHAVARARRRASRRRRWCSRWRRTVAGRTSASRARRCSPGSPPR